MITRSTLKKCKPENVIRLAKYLKLNIENMSYGQVIRLIHWRLRRKTFN